MALRRRKSRKDQVLSLLETYLKLQAAKKATKGARKAAKGTAVYQVAKRTPIVKRIPIIAGAGVAALVVAAKLRSSGGDASALGGRPRRTPPSLDRVRWRQLPTGAWTICSVRGRDLRPSVPRFRTRLPPP